MKTKLRKNEIAFLLPLWNGTPRKRLDSRKNKVIFLRNQICGLRYIPAMLY